LNEVKSQSRAADKIFNDASLSCISELYEERAQIEAIYHKLYSWVSCLFEDKSLEDMLTSLRSSGLAIDPSEIAPAPELQG
jgi:hypothetical protein